jgi:hypothetical protein
MCLHLPLLVETLEPPHLKRNLLTKLMILLCRPPSTAIRIGLRMPVLQDGWRRWEKLSAPT